MSVLVITPAQPFVSKEEALAHLRDPEEQDELIEVYVAAACAWIDGPAGWLGRSFGAQTLELRGNVFASGARLPYGPVREIVSVKYVSPAGVEETLPPAIYQLCSDALELTPGASWPSLRGDAEGVRVRYAAGDEATKVPASAKQAVLLLVGHWFRNRMAVNTGNLSVTEMPFGVEALLSPFRTWRI
ncbi:Phage gp6-like head-tail connector protein [compost metagenome]